MTFVFWFSLQILAETFLILRRIHRVAIINVYRSLYKVPVISVRFEWNVNFLDIFSKNVGLLWLKLHSTRRGLFLTSTLDLDLRKKPVKCCIWSIPLYGAGTWTLQAVDQKRLGSFEMCWRRMEKISWTDHVRNEEVRLKNQGAEEYPTRNK